MSKRESYRVVVTGGRDFKDLELMTQKLDAMLVKKSKTHDIVIISGTANGADRLGEAYADKRNYAVIRMPAQWELHGKRAGYLRNAAMVEASDAVVCFWDEKSRGTEHTIRLAKEHKRPLRVVKY